MLTFISQVPNRGSIKFPKRKQPSRWFWLGLIALVGLGVYLSSDDKSPIVEEDGQPRLAPWRQKKLDRELEQLENAEVYALMADRPGEYPCYHCPQRPLIFLNFNAVWRYGVTTRGETGRYPMGLPQPSLRYVVLYEGDLLECLKKEKFLIYEYALLPENLRRPRPLIRPPGNKIDH